VANRRDFDRLPLRVFGIAEHGHRVHVLARGDVAQGEGRTDKIALIPRERTYPLHEGIAQAALEQLRRKGRGADQTEPLDRGVGKAGHGFSLIAGISPQRPGHM
jgi:hypothetical protein